MSIKPSLKEVTDEGIDISQYQNYEARKETYTKVRCNSQFRPYCLLADQERSMAKWIVQLWKSFQAHCSTINLSSGYLLEREYPYPGIQTRYTFSHDSLLRLNSHCRTPNHQTLPPHRTKLLNRWQNKSFFNHTLKRKWVQQHPSNVYPYLRQQS